MFWNLSREWHSRSARRESDLAKLQQKRATHFPATRQHIHWSWDTRNASICAQRCFQPSDGISLGFRAVRDPSKHHIESQHFRRIKSNIPWVLSPFSNNFSTLQVAYFLGAFELPQFRTNHLALNLIIGGMARSRFSHTCESHRAAHSLCFSSFLIRRRFSIRQVAYFVHGKISTPWFPTQNRELTHASVTTTEQSKRMAPAIRRHMLRGSSDFPTFSKQSISKHQNEILLELSETFRIS